MKHAPPGGVPTHPTQGEDPPNACPFQRVRFPGEPPPPPPFGKTKSDNLALEKEGFRTCSNELFDPRGLWRWAVHASGSSPNWAALFIPEKVPVQSLHKNMCVHWVCVHVNFYRRLFSKGGCRVTTVSEHNPEDILKGTPPQSWDFDTFPWEGGSHYRP